MGWALREILRGGLPPGSDTIQRLLDGGHSSDSPLREVVQLPEAERQRFSEMTFAELLNLHEGNIARYRIGLREFEDWQSRWSGEAV